jgi:two-component system, cell cycle sensor histidine kinase DivJ
VKPSQPIGDYLDALVHPSARQDALMAMRHRAFIAPRLIGSLLALAALPVFLALRGVPSALEFIVLVWMVAPIATACYLSRTGRYESAHVLSALALIGIAVAAHSGGVNSIAAIWLVLIPLEAATSGSRRVVAVAAMLALGGAVLLMLADPAAGVSATGAIAALGIVSVLLYATGIALGAEGIAHTDSRLPVLTVVVPLSSPMVSVTPTGPAGFIAVRSTFFPIAPKMKLLPLVFLISNVRFIPLITPTNE